MPGEPLQAEAGPPEPGPRPPEDEAAEVVASFARLLRTITPRAWVVPTLVVVNAAVLAAMVASGVSALAPTAANLVAWGGDFGPKALGAQPWRMLTSAFLHIGVVHLAMNMVALWDAGRTVERIFGHARFAALYLVAALCASAASLAVHPQIVSAGASGAVFGVYGALGAFLLRQRGTVPRAALSRLGRVAAGFVAYNVLYGFAIPGIDAAAHLGGLAGGAAAGAWLARPLLPERREGWKAPTLAAVAGIALAALAWVALPSPGDLEAVVGAFARDESRLLATYDDLLGRSRAGTISDAELAARVEQDVVAPWHEARMRVAAPARWAPRQRELLALLGRYADARERGWTSFASFARDHDRARLDEAKAHHAEAERLVEELKRFQ